jgi:hypothetical protein
MTNNLFEAWGAVQGSLQRLGDAVVAEREALEVCGGHAGDEYYVPREAAVGDAMIAHYEAVKNYRELTQK